MDYEYYYDNARSRYYNACSEINSCENGIKELKSQKQQKINQINQLKTDIKNNQKAFDEIGQIMKSDANFNAKLAEINNKTNEAAANFSEMIASSDVVNKNLNDVYNEEMTNTKRILHDILEIFSSRKNALSARLQDLNNQLRCEESDLENIKSSINTKEDDLGYWKRQKNNASNDMEYYRRKMSEAG